MEITLYNLLNTNKSLNDLIGENNISPIFTSKLGEKACLEYEYRILKSGLVYQSQFSINIISKNYDFILEVKELLNKILVDNLDDDFKVIGNYKFNIKLAGGSSPIYQDDLKIYKVNLNYLVRWVEINK